MKKNITHNYYGVIVEQSLNHIELPPEKNCALKLNWEAHGPNIGRCGNFRGENGKLVCDIQSDIDLKGKYPGIAFTVLEKINDKPTAGKLLYVSASDSLNIDETLEPFI